MIAGLSARKILDAAKNTGDADIFYTTFRFFEERNYRTRGRVDFSPGEWRDQGRGILEKLKWEGKSVSKFEKEMFYANTGAFDVSEPPHVVQFQLTQALSDIKNMLQF